MARMLQALKNLEARGQAGLRTAHTGESPGTPQPALAEAATMTVPIEAMPIGAGPDAAALNATQVVSTIEFAASQIAGLTVCVDDGLDALCARTQVESSSPALGAVISEAFGRPTLPAPPAAAELEAARPGQGFLPAREFMAPPGPPVAQPERASLSVVRQDAAATAKERERTAIERLAARRLSDPIGSRPIVDLADRFQADAKQTGSQTVVLASVGTTRGTAETLVLASTVLAERRQRDLLLVDADLTRRTLSSLLDGPGLTGLGDVLGTATSAQPHIVQTSTAHLKLLAAGRADRWDDAASESRLEAVLKELGREYGLVLIDGGVASSSFTLALARQADATYLVVELGAVEASVAQAALRDLRAAGARVLGCIAT